MSKKKVFIVTPGGARAKGGMGRMVSYFTRRLASDDEIAFEIVDSYGPAVNTAGAKAVMPLYFAGAVARVLGGCLRAEIGLAHIHMAVYGSVLRKSAIIMVCRAFGVPVVLHIHGGELEKCCADLGPLGLGLLRRVLGTVNEVVVLGSYWQRLVAEVLGVPVSRTTILPNPVPRPAIEPTYRDGAACHILFLGTLSDKKGVPELLSALASPIMSGRHWRLTMAGTGEIEPYANQAKRLGIDGRIDFAGWTSEERTQALLASADMLVLPSHVECLPMVVLEAMAYGLPVVTTPVGATAEVITDGETGFLVPVGDIEAVARAIARLIDEPLLRRRLGEAARVRFCRDFDLDVFDRRIRAIYRKYLPVGG
jgi:glycosyltransferase involved in cell wall biosynthesis